MTRIITVTSGKGGVGKTTVTANIGISLALMGKKVCLIDADFGLNNLDIPLGLTNRMFYDLKDYFQGRCTLNQLMIQSKQLPALSLIASSEMMNVHEMSVSFQRLLSQLSQQFDFILIDSLAGIESGFHEMISIVNEVIIVTTPNNIAMRDADRVIGLLLNKVPSVNPVLIMNMVGIEEQEAIAKIKTILQIDLLGLIKDDLQVIRSIQAGVPISLNPQHESGLRFRHIARNLKNREIKPFILPGGEKQKKERNRSFPYFHRSLYS